MEPRLVDVYIEPDYCGEVIIVIADQHISVDDRIVSNSRVFSQPCVSQPRP